jgi:hypothetical protein
VIQQIKENEHLSLNDFREAENLFDDIEEVDKYLKEMNDRKGVMKKDKNSAHPPLLNQDNLSVEKVEKEQLEHNHEKI